MKMNDVILYQEDGWNPDKIIDIVNQKKSVKEYAIILHDKDLDEENKPKKPHYHVFLNYGNGNVKPKDVAAWFNIKENAVERIHTNKFRTLRYYLHLDEENKHKYSIDELISNFDVQKYFLSEENKMSKSELIKLCAEGVINRQNFHEHIDPETFIKYEPAIISAWDYYSMKKESESKNRRSCEVIWIFGETEVGKTTLATMIAEKHNLSYYITAGGKDPFSNYKGEEVLILDDPRPESPFTFSELLKILDPNFLTPVHSRYRNKIIYAIYIFVTNPYSPDKFYELMPFKNPDDKPAQLYRRISEIWKLTKEKIVSIKYDPETGRFVENGSTPNPVANMLDKVQAVKPKPAVDLLDDMLDGKYKSFFGEVIDDDIPF